ncbi:hypothetical protein [uncultured Sphingomonas sp.]|uniref:hypothetical protein n=1 Tax=uncultured Sphingomonas sp. TaxID=158754 RepID=UPI0026215EBB|nr:hypothetical protein [uncultured Sphingomonas sp.]
METEAKAAPGNGGHPRWPEAGREAFLDCLAATCNVAAAAVAGGVHEQTVHKWRRKDAAFAQAWGEALALGYAMLETRLVGHALAGEADGGVIAGGEAMPAVSVELALKLLTRHRDAPGKPRRENGHPRRYADKDDTDRVILARLAQIEARRAKVAARDRAK